MGICQNHETSTGVRDDFDPQVSVAIEEVLDCPHTIRVLHKAGVQTMEELAQHSREDLLQLRGIGKVIAGDLTEVIEKWNAEHQEAGL